VPLVGIAPFQAPAALHEVALVEVQVSVTDPPAFTLIEDALSDTVGALTVAAPPPPHAAASITEPAINSRDIKRTYIPT
jgi:hypothetical protein